MLSRSLSDCQSLTLNVMIQVSQVVSSGQLCHYVTNSLNRSQCLCLCSYCSSYRHHREEAHPETNELFM